MAEQSIGIQFPFVESKKGFFLGTTKISKDQVKSNLLHVLLTEKGSRLYSPLFGTNLLKFIFEPNDDITYADVKSDIQNSVTNFIPNIVINDIQVKLDELTDTSSAEIDQTIFDQQGTVTTKTHVSGKINTDSGQIGHGIQVRIDFTVTEGTFESNDFVIIKF